MSLIVVDASVAAKWFLPANGESLVEEAFALLQLNAKEQIQFIVPDFFWVEFANVIWKTVRVGRFPKVSAEAALASLTQRNFPTVPSLKLLDSAFQIATAFERAVYDSLYVALAVEAKAQLITADERLADALGGRFPVKWLGAV